MATQSKLTMFSQPLTVLAALTFRERFEEANYGFVKDGITEENFPVTEEQFGDWKGELFNFGEDMSPSVVEDLIWDDGYGPRLAGIGHILALGENFPQEQVKGPVVALGAEVQKQVPALWMNEDGFWLRLELIRVPDQWPPDVWFLGVRRFQFG